MQTLIATCSLAQFADDRDGPGGDRQTLIVQLNGVVTGIVGFSAVIAAVGIVNNLSLSVLQRPRELGLLRVLGLTGRRSVG